jgi:hypothetical protein
MNLAAVCCGRTAESGDSKPFIILYILNILKRNETKSFIVQLTYSAYNKSSKYLI